MLGMSSGKQAYRRRARVHVTRLRPLRSDETCLIVLLKHDRARLPIRQVPSRTSRALRTAEPANEKTKSNATSIHPFPPYPIGDSLTQAPAAAQQLLAMPTC